MDSSAGTYAAKRRTADEIAALLRPDDGVADLTMLTERERVEALIAIAHPDFRDDLRRSVPARTAAAGT